MKNRPITQLLATAVASLVLGASATGEEIQLRGISLAGRDVGGEVYLHDGTGEPGSSLRVKRFLNHQREKLSLQPGTLTVTKAADPASTTDPELKLAEVELEAGTGSAILLFVPGSGDEKVAARLIEDSEKAFPGGSFLIVSHCDEPLKIDLEGKEFEVESGATKLIANPVSGDHPGMVQMTALRQEGDAWKPIASGRWALPGEARELHVATINPGSGNIEIRGIKDVGQAE